MEAYKTLAALMENEVLPLSRKHPHWIRLDGADKGGNRQVFARFRYEYKTWKIHADTHIAQLLAAYALDQNGEKPFFQSKTDKGNFCLRLSSQETSTAEGLYIYLDDVP